MKYDRAHYIEKLIKHEGIVLNVYKDSLGIDTIGIGRNLEDRGITKEELDYLDIPSINHVYEFGITEEDAVYLATNDIEIVEEELCRAHSCVEDLDAVRQLVVMDMAFNMGAAGGGGLAAFKNMKRAVLAKQYEKAADEMTSSRWCGQVGRRCRNLVGRMRALGNC